MAKKIQPHERFYIEQNPDNLSTKELAKMFSRGEQIIRNIMNSHKKQVAQNTKDEASHAESLKQIEPPPPQVKKTSKINVDQFMGKHKRNGQVVATVMTPTASELSDEVRNDNKKPFSQTLKSAIHKPRGE